jgi:hypothetical protein
LEEYNASPTAFFDLNVFANGESYFFSGDFSQSVAPNTSIVEMEVAQNSASQIWGPYLTASATMSITDNGAIIFNNTSIYSSGSAQYSVTSSVNFQSGHTYIISASNQPYITASCCTPTITSASISGGDISIFFTTASGCSGCTATTIERSVDGSIWTGSNTGGCTSPRVIDAPTSSMYYRIQQVCGELSSSFSDSYYFNSGSGSGVTAVGVFGYMEPCIGGTIDDHMGASVYTDNEVSVDTEFEVQVSYTSPGASCGSGESTQFFYVTIPAGSTTSNFNACSNGAYFPAGANICSACINTCDNPLVFISSSVSC